MVSVRSPSIDPFHHLHSFLSNANKLVYIAHFSGINMSLPLLFYFLSFSLNYMLKNKFCGKHVYDVS